jgi:hypothetical protein
MSFGMTLVFVYMGEGSSGDSIVIISENQYSGESPLLPSSLYSPKPAVIPNSSTHKNKLFNRNTIRGRMRDLKDPNKLLKVLFSVKCI